MDLQDNAQVSSPSGSQTHFPNHSTSSSTVTKTTTGSHRIRLQQQALVILEDFFRHVSQNPNHAEKEALVKKIKAIPGCSDYDVARLTRWFGSRRHRLRLKERKENDNINDPRFPSLTPDAVQHLIILASNQLHPSPELLKTWTTLLASSGAVEQDVINWIHHRNQEQSSQHATSPSDTTLTPEPLAISPIISPISNLQTKSTSPPYKKETTTSPTALQLAHPDASKHLDARSTPSEPSPISNNNKLNQCIIHGVRDALASPQTMPGMSTAAPKSAAEFKALFSPYEQQISHLLHSLQSTSRIGAPIDQ